MFGLNKKKKPVSDFHKFVVMGGRQVGRTSVSNGINEFYRNHISELDKPNSWDDEELEELDQKVDALMEFLQIEFVEERVVNGGIYGCTEKAFMRKKNKK